MTDPYCKVEGCDRARDTSIGYCYMHYSRWKRNRTINSNRRPFDRCNFCNKLDDLTDNLCKTCIARKRYSGSLEYKRAKNGEGHINSDGYKQITCKHGRELEHRIIAKAPAGKVVHHKDGNKLNNSPDNLEIMTQSEHMKLHQRERKA